MRLIAWYLPQFHEIPENNKWWGEGFTEWTNVRKAEKLTSFHNQPRVPINCNYYNLLDDTILKWQIDLAKQYGLYGFCMHHYWFAGKLLLEKPVENFLANKDLEFPFCLNWANEHWTNQWTSSSEKILIEQQYGGKMEWKEHFEYLLPFFKDSRYIKIDGRPMFTIYRPEFIECLNEMLDCWQELAENAGFSGMAFSYVGMKWDYKKNKDDSRFMFDIEYQPSTIWNKERQKYLSVKIADKLPRWVTKTFIKPLNMIKGWLSAYENKDKRILDYDEIWSKILNSAPSSSKSIPGAFVDWDNTPRKGNKGIFLRGASPEKFEIYLKQQMQRATEIYNKDIIFVFSWNEWCEGGYLEPDELNGYGYLQAIKNALDNVR